MDKKQIKTADDWDKMMNGEQFQTAAGDPAHQAASGEWLQPTENPFGHGCCDCGLFHQVEFRVVDHEGVVQDLEGFHLQLRFTRDDGETARLREHKGVNRG